MKKLTVSAFPDGRSKHHIPAHVEAFVLDPTNFIIEEGKSTARINVQALRLVIISEEGNYHA